MACGADNESVARRGKLVSGFTPRLLSTRYRSIHSESFCASLVTPHVHSRTNSYLAISLIAVLAV